MLLRYKIIGELGYGIFNRLTESRLNGAAAAFRKEITDMLKYAKLLFSVDMRELCKFDEGGFSHDRHHGWFKHQFFSSGRIEYSNWDHGRKI